MFKFARLARDGFIDFTESVFVAELISSVDFQRLKNFNQKLLNLAKGLKVELKIEMLQQIATLNWQFHMGEFFSDEIEDELIEIGRNLNNNIECDQLRNTNVLHVVSELYNTGGHTRLMENYIRALPGVENHLFITRQSLSGIPDRIKNNRSIKLINYQVELSILEKSRLLASIWDSYDKVLLHIHPDDVIPNISFGMNPINSIYYVNHADHVFWLGSKILNYCISIRPLAIQIAQEKRNIQNNILIPIVLDLSEVHKDNIKVDLNAGRRIVFGSMTAPHKIVRTSKHNFIADIVELLSLFQNSVFYLIGVTLEDLNVLGYNCKNLNDRLVLLGPVENPSSLLREIDIYLEGYPQNSLTALYESILFGCCPVLMHTVENINCNMESDMAFKKLICHSKNKQEYLEYIKTLVENKNYRHDMVSELQKRLKFYNNGIYLSERLDRKGENEIPPIPSTLDLEELSYKTLLFDSKQLQLRGIEFKWHTFFNIALYKRMPFLSKLKLRWMFYWINTSVDFERV